MILTRLNQVSFLLVLEATWEPALVRGMEGHQIPVLSLSNTLGDANPPYLTAKDLKLSRKSLSYTTL